MAADKNCGGLFPLPSTSVSNVLLRLSILVAVIVMTLI